MEIPSPDMSRAIVAKDASWAEQRASERSSARAFAAFLSIPLASDMSLSMMASR